MILNTNLDSDEFCQDVDVSNLINFFRIERMARDIHESFNSESLTILCILKGGFRFTQDMMDALNALNRSSGA